jgi:hypothetical protein
MAQLSNIGRKTKVVRIPRKYEFLVKSFAVYLSTYPDQAKLWNCEEYLQAQQEESNHQKDSTLWRKDIAKALRVVLGQLKQS